ncbi:hypothetical protein M0R88_05750 [Halorussus gelatinilyticus]|uniref:Uncharacterized protein n=1 Tax=Halorussus gelatinilyticus TaxID=2937524 RepID=A0A8U0IKD7_9EURY|nr:hypothetical protein [Halorussus gelatinilyticus]UPW01607.1 hypothetical protein M0R88_05750 [Halorussus gelatinilyticus]
MTAEETLDEQAVADESEESDADRERSHLSDVADGAGCTEIWEHLSDRREDEADEE